MEDQILGWGIYGLWKNRKKTVGRGDGRLNKTWVYRMVQRERLSFIQMGTTWNGHK